MSICFAPGGVFPKGCAAFLLIFLVLASSPASARDDLAGTWETRHLLDRITARVEQQGDHFSGLVVIHQFLGDESTYHFTGTVKNHIIDASHYQGHVFHGKILPDGKVTGALTTKSGIRIEIELVR